MHIPLAPHLLNDHIYGISKRFFIIFFPMNSMDFFDIHSDLVEFPGPLHQEVPWQECASAVGKQTTDNWVHMPSMRWINYVECSHIFQGLCFDPISNRTARTAVDTCLSHWLELEIVWSKTSRWLAIWGLSENVIYPNSTDQSSKYPLNCHNLEVSVSSFSDTSYMVSYTHFPKRSL